MTSHLEDSTHERRSSSAPDDLGNRRQQTASSQETTPSTHPTVAALVVGGNGVHRQHISLGAATGPPGADDLSNEGDQDLFDRTHQSDSSHREEDDRHTTTQAEELQLRCSDRRMRQRKLQGDRSEDLHTENVLLQNRSADRLLWSHETIDSRGQQDMEQHSAHSQRDLEQERLQARMDTKNHNQNCHMMKKKLNSPHGGVLPNGVGGDLWRARIRLLQRETVKNRSGQSDQIEKKSFQRLHRRKC